MSIRDAIEARNKITMQHTRSIFQVYGKLFDNIFYDMNQFRMVIQWVAIDLHPVNQNFLTVVGLAQYNPGETILIGEDTTVFIDETNKGNYVKAMRLMVPCDPVNTGDVKTITTFLKEYSNILNTIDPDEVDNRLADNNFLRDNFSLYRDIIMDDQPQNKNTIHKDMYEGFNLLDFELDEMQITQLKLGRPEGQS